MTSAPAAAIFAPVVSSITPASNPRIYLIFLIMLASVAAAAAAFRFFGLAAGIAASIAAAIICRVLYSFLHKHMAARIRTGEEGISVDPTGKNPMLLRWTDIRLAGIAVGHGRPGSRRNLFLYKEDGDVLLEIPDEFQDFDALVAEVKARTAFNEIGLQRGEELKGRLKALLEST